MNIEYFLNSGTSLQWKKIGIKRRAGVVVPLFSVWSDVNCGIGEFTDLKLLTDWCTSNGLSIIQLLPLNEMGSDNSPYNSISSFGLEPAFINLRTLQNVFISDAINQKLNRLYSPKKNKSRVDYGVKNKKLKLLRKIFLDAECTSEFYEFINLNRYWLDCFAMFKLLKSLNDNKHWEDWAEEMQDLNSDFILSLKSKYAEELKFIKWIQWQAYLQLGDAKKYATENEINLIGDLPYLVSPDSADVWQNQNYFQLDKVVGAPPDMYMSKGQRWGMHPYNWMNIATDGFDYLKEKLNFASNFYHSYRIDHFIGLLRIWTIKKELDEEIGGAKGQFEPGDESVWKKHGEEILDEFIKASDMLPVAEDLGTVPESSYQILYESGIPGIEVMRWKRDWSHNGKFTEPEYYRLNSISVLSTHDSSTLLAWWKYEAGQVDIDAFYRDMKIVGLDDVGIITLSKRLFKKSINSSGRVKWKSKIDTEKIREYCKGLPDEVLYKALDLFKAVYYEKEKYSDLVNCDIETNSYESVVSKSLEKILKANSVFSVQLLNDWLFLDEEFVKKHSRWSDRINFPGTVSKRNWSWKTPVSLNQLLKSDINLKIKHLVSISGR